MVDPFSVRIAIRGYELDAQGHVNGAVYLQYAEHARWECLRAAGLTQQAMHEQGITPVRLEESVRYHRELRGGDEVEVGCVFDWGDGDGKTFRVRQDFRRDDTLVAEVTNVGGVLGLETRRLLPDPGAHFRRLAATPTLLGL